MTAPYQPSGPDGAPGHPNPGSVPSQSSGPGGYPAPYQQGQTQQAPYQQAPYGMPPQGGYPIYGQPGPYGFAPRAPKRPGIATGTGVVGIILGIQMFPYAAGTLIGAATLSDDPTEYGRGLVPVLWIVGIIAVIAAVTLFVGAIQLLSGSNVMVVRLGAVLAIVAIWILTVWALMEFTEIEQGKAVIITTAVLLTILPSTVLGLSLSPTISKWFSKKKAFRAAGLDDD